MKSIRLFVLTQLILLQLIVTKNSYCQGLGFDLSEYKKAVTFIFILDDSSKLIPNGTGFYLGVKPEKELEHKREQQFVYLVTAKHVLFDKKKNDYYKNVYLRTETQDGGLENISIPLLFKGKDQTVFLHPDTTVDLAVINVFPNPRHFLFTFLPSRMLLSPEEISEFKIREGTDIFFYRAISSILWLSGKPTDNKIWQNSSCK